MFKVGVAERALDTRYSPTALVSTGYLTALATRMDSIWLPDHLNALWPRSIATPKYVGAARILSKADAFLEPWTVLGHLAARNRLGRMRLGIGVTDAGRRNPAVTAQAAATLHLLTRGRAILGIGTGERENNQPYGVIGPRRWHDSKKPWPPSGRYGTPAVNWSPATRPISRCATLCSTCPLSREVAEDLDSRPRAADAARHWALRRRLVSCAHLSAHGLRSGPGGGSGRCLRRRARSPVHHSRELSVCGHWS
jgi:hypothetical protein